MRNILHINQPPTEVLAHVASNVRRLRLAAGLSQASLADAAGLSRRMLVLLENGDTNISLSSLDRLAAALGASFIEIVSDPFKQPARIEAVAWRGSKEQSSATLLGSAAAHKRVELWSWSLAPGDVYEADADPAGWQEMLYVIEGQLEITLPEGRKTVAAGDFTIFSSAQPYAYRALGESVARFIRNVVI